MEKIIVDPGVIPVEYVKDTLKKTPYEVYFIGENFNCPIWERNGIEKTIPYQSFNDIRSIKHLEYIKAHYNEVYNAILNNGHTPLLSERSFYQKVPWTNFFNGLMSISNLIINYMDYICGINPKFMFYHSTPHNIYSWVFGKVCELMGIPVYISKRSALPWRSFLTKGINEYDIIPIKNNFDDTKVINEFIKVNSGNFADAISPYEKKGIEARKGKFWSWKAEFQFAMKADTLAKKLFVRPMISIFRKYPLYKYYQSLAINNYNGKYVVVFLHYQPERTSLPEGFNFTQQLHLVRTLRLGLPKDVAILIKEHPATFVGHFDMRCRIKEFYKLITQFDNTKLLDISSDSFTIIDNAMAVATMTGTAGAQSMVRGVPVLAFGKAPYLDAPDCYPIYNVEDVQNAFIKIQESSKEDVHSRTVDYYHSISNITTTGASNTDETEFHSKKLHLIASAYVFDQLLTDVSLIQ